MSGFGGNVNDGAIILCKKGWARIKINLKDYEIVANSEIVLLPDCICAIMESSEDFEVQQFSMEEERFFAACRNINPDFFGRLKNYPVYMHNEKTLPASQLTLALLKAYGEDERMACREDCEMLLVRSLMLTIHDFIERSCGNEPQLVRSKRPAQLCERFIRLVIHYCARERTVSWYAGKLCVSARYLSQATGETIGQSPKEIIDNYAMQEISLLLTHSELSIQQIADKMHFSDQSTLGRYFKQHSGIAPLKYRTGTGTKEL
ncbi:MAG: helix-turn-helix transcriptional regulator [Candidatus Cryptobacteroides sp.]